MFFCLLLPLPFPASKKIVFYEYIVASGNGIVLCYLMASHCNPMAFNLHIPNFVVAFLRVRRWVVHYASMQFRQLLYKQKSNQESWVLKPEVGVSQNSLQVSQVSQMRNLRCALCLFFSACAICVCESVNLIFIAL